MHYTTDPEDRAEFIPGPERDDQGGMSDAEAPITCQACDGQFQPEGTD